MLAAGKLIRLFPESRTCQETCILLWQLPYGPHTPYPIRRRATAAASAASSWAASGRPPWDRNDWDEWLQARRAEHHQRTATIIELETDLNVRVYTLFDLTPAEIKIIEESTKYKYGEV